MADALLDAGAYAESVTAAVAVRAGGLTALEGDQLYGALYAAAATGIAPLPRPEDFNADALARIVLDGRHGPCSACRRPISDHDLDVAAFPWVRCREAPAASTSAARRAWLLWVGVPLLSAGLLSWLPSLLAARRRRRQGWGPAAGLLVLLTLVFWTPPQDLATVMMFWLATVIYGATQVRPWLRAEAAPG